MQVYTKGTKLIYYCVEVELPNDANIDDAPARESHPDCQMKVFIDQDGKRVATNVFDRSLRYNFYSQVSEWIEKNGYPMFVLPKGSNVHLGDQPILTLEDHYLQVFYDSIPPMNELNHHGGPKGEGYILLDYHSDKHIVIGFWNEDISLYQDQLNRREYLEKILS